MKKLLIALSFLFIGMVVHAQSLGVGYMNFWTVNAEIKINKDQDELRLWLHGDYYYPITKLAIMYQPKITNWELHPIFAIGPSVGYWRNKKRSFYYPSDVQLSQNSTWKHNPVVGLDGAAGLEYGRGRVSIEAGAYYWLCLSDNFGGEVRPFVTVKLNFHK